jgi:hypothetical protein
MLLRGIRDVQSYIDNALKSGQFEDFEELEKASQIFKEYLNHHVQAPEIRSYIQRTPKVENCNSTGAAAFWLIGLLVNWVGSSIVSHVQRLRELESITHELRDHYGNLEVLVMLMGMNLLFNHILHKAIKEIFIHPLQLSALT